MLAPRECCTKGHSRTFVSNVLRLCAKDEMQGAEDEAEGSVLTYVTETEFRKQRSRSPSCNSLSIGIGHLRSGDRCADTRLNSLYPLRVAEQIFPYRRPLWASHSPGKLDSATPYRSRRLLALSSPRVFGATPLDRCLKSEHPCRGASITTLPIELNDLCKAQMRQPSRACIA